MLQRVQWWVALEVFKWCSEPGKENRHTYHIFTTLDPFAFSPEHCRPWFRKAERIGFGIRADSALISYSFRMSPYSPRLAQTTKRARSFSSRSTLLSQSSTPINTDVSPENASFQLFRVLLKGAAVILCSSETFYLMRMVSPPLRGQRKVQGSFRISCAAGVDLADGCTYVFSTLVRAVSPRLIGSPPLLRAVRFPHTLE